MAKKRRTRSKKRDKSRTDLKSASSKDTGVREYLNYDEESCVRQVLNLKDEIKKSQYIIDNLCLMTEDIRSIQCIKEGDKLVLKDYLENCIIRKDSEISSLLKKEKELEEWTKKQHEEHENRVARLLLEMEAVVERLGSEKANLAGKIASMEEIRVQRDQLHAKFEEISRTLEDLEEQNRRNFHKRDLEVTVEQKRLYDEMQRRCIQLSDEFLVVTKQRMAKSQLLTLEINCGLHKQLHKLGDRSTMLLGQNHSTEQAIVQVKRDVEVMNEVAQKMKQKFRSCLKEFQDMISQCKSKENELLQLTTEIDPDTKPTNSFSDAYSARTTELQAEKERLATILTDKKSLLETLKAEETDIDECLAEDACHLRGLVTANEGLNDMLRDTDMALTDSLELFTTSTAINFTERRKRQDHLLTALFILLHTSNHACGRIDPQSLGAPSLRCTTGWTYTTKSAKMMKSPCTRVSGFSEFTHNEPSRTDDNMPGLLPEDSHDHVMISPEKLLEFGLIQVDDRQISRNPAAFHRDLSVTAKGLNRYLTNQPNFCSVGVQTNRQTHRSGYRPKKEIHLPELFPASGCSEFEKRRRRENKTTVDFKGNDARQVNFDLSSSTDNALPSLQFLALI
ncbi:hypothetical protein D915_008772 [Fasciola hepatica]|uniref:Cilia- and flagella-associated protein 157 n=1 Tax=Fasciola hepatica TaxID=6192 RepID=A0A4E0QZG6_FASHE|nr:hypothetical protein D915_008772 [Fasciola hepatica]